MYGVVYKATNILTKESYIGQARDFERRKAAHLAIHYGETSQFQNALLKYGYVHFEWEIICECDTKKELSEMEYHYIKQYGSVGLYNVTGNNGENRVYVDHPADVYKNQCLDEAMKDAMILMNL